MATDDPALAAAIKRQEERLQRDPASLAFAQLADLYRKAGRPGEAIALCRGGLQRYPHYTTARLILAKALGDEGEHEAALAELAAILEISPKDLQSHRMASEILRRLGRIDEAVEHLQSIVRLDSGDREARALLGLLRADPRTDAEAAGVGRVLRDDVFATVSFGSVCLDQGLVEEAAQVFTRILRQDPANHEARERLEQALRARSRRKG
ncbi:MAG: tetratricopeptide repeat protein [Candidatus Rokubacteria bacterium]|nr:tetratricopeptide repeat protein [Candidatus Rokubacteria bacterium]MBI3825544.1 tetratricopeptide repeat protein [Candidatus Rokubacteria bacterium]